MPSILNTRNEYGSVAILMHWIMAVIIIGLLILGIYMVDLPVSLRKLQLYGWHKEIGMLVLMLALIRVLWRFTNITPQLLGQLPVWEVVAARSVHWMFYLLMGILPITGWAMSSAAGLPVSFFGLFVFPDLVSPNENLRVTLQNLHGWLAYVLIVLICLHAVAALKHHIINKNDILRRMLP